MRIVVRGEPAKARWMLRTVLVASCAVGMLAAASGQALAKTTAASAIDTHTPVTNGSTYLALGDSVTFGYEESSVNPPPTYTDASTFLGYPELLGSELHLNVVNLACPGETSASFIRTKSQSNGCENHVGGPGGYRTAFPLHESYGGSQLAFATSFLLHHPKVRLVSLMIDANDFFVCQETTTDGCTSSSELAGVVGSVTQNVTKILSDIRNKAHYKGQLAIVNYYSLDYSNTTDNELSTLLNQTQDNAAAPFHVVIADGFAELQAAAAHSGGNTCTAGLLTQLVAQPTPCGIHPSYAGQSLLAQALAKVIRIG
jgi:lysophospholipase L1-like esterase